MSSKHFVSLYFFRSSLLLLIKLQQIIKYVKTTIFRFKEGEKKNFECKKYMLKIIGILSPNHPSTYTTKYISLLVQ